MGGTGENSLRQRMRSGRICVLHSGQAYDVTDFSDRHPGGREWLEKLAGQDVTQVMQDATPHKHTKAAYAILEKYRIRDDDHDKQNGDARSSVFHFHNMQEDPLIDWNKPLLWQVPKLGRNYFTWVHQPVDTSMRLFHSDLFEFFSKCPWYMVPIIWVPVTIFMMLSSHANFGAQSVAWNVFGVEVWVTAAWLLPLYLFGLLLWTFCEYTIHRWIFHMAPPENWQFLIWMHFILHGQHHKSPMDRMRLVFPTVPATIFAVAIFSLYSLVGPLPVAQAMFAGTLTGYIAYDLTHYYIHHGSPIPFYFASLKRYHVKHHFENQQLGFGISSKLWDYPFGTLIPDSE